MSNASHPPPPSPRDLATNDDGPAGAADDADPAAAALPDPNTTGPHQSPDKVAPTPNTTGPRQ